MTENDLKALSNDLQHRLKAIATAIRPGSLSVHLREELLHDLAATGYHAFSEIFKLPGSQNIINELLQNNPGATIVVSSDRFFLPWELLYPVPLDEEFPSYEKFWGMNYIISRTITPHGGKLRSTIRFKNQPYVGLLADRTLRGVTRKELPFFRKLRDEQQITLHELDRLNPHPDERRAGFFVLIRFWKENFDIAHFACHAAYDTEAPSRSYFRVSNNFAVTIKEFVSYHAEIHNSPLVIMNACETGNLNPLYTCHFAETLLERGAGGVVTTECAVNDMFAADFIEQLYIRLLDGAPLGACLLDARRYFIEKYRNPAGLLYSLYAMPSLYLEKE